MFKVRILILILILSVSYHQVFAEEVSIKTSKSTYSYGDFLSFTVTVSEITGDFAVFKIIDEKQIASSPINLEIKDKTTTITAPFPFESSIFNEGLYTVEIHYSGKTAQTSFSLVDSGRVVIPVWIKDLASWWTQGLVTDFDFAKGIEYLIKEKIIVIAQTELSGPSDEVTIPDWVRTTTVWWTNDQVSDEEFANALQHLIKIKVLVINDTV